MSLIMFLILILSLTSLPSSLSSTSNYLNIKPANFEQYEKYTINSNKNKIPTLEHLFQKVTYWDISNSSNPCKHEGRKRMSLCQKVFTFDRAGYERSLTDTKQLILSRLNLKQEPDIQMNKHTLDFIDELENNLMHVNGKRSQPQQQQQQHSTIKTKYDKKISQNKILNSMHEALSVSNCEMSDDTLDEDQEESVEEENSLCINFEIPLKNFFKTTKENHNVYARKLNSVVLWLFLRPDYNQDLSSSNFELRIENLNTKQLKILDRNQLVDGWNTINMSDVIFNLESMNENGKMTTDYSNKTQSLKIKLECFPLCTIGYSDDEYTENAESISILLSNSQTRKPLLSVKIYEEISSDMLPLNSKAAAASADVNTRNKRRVMHNHNQNINYKANGIERDNYNPRLCYNNYPDSNRECCLITYFVNFNSLKWSSWILHPPGFVANYCSGKCNDLKSFKYAGHNAEVKLKYNERLLSKDTFDAGEMLETCCHPISMDSLVIKYLATNGSVVSTVIPNMIITGCGCS